MAVLKALSLFTGVGGLDFGFEAAGFKTAAAVEVDRTCCATLRRNRPAWPVIECDIHAIGTEEILATAGLTPGKVDVLVGGPPCQPFSKSGYWAHGDAKRLSDPRASTLSAYLRVLEEVRPRAFLIENVSGIAYSGKDEGLAEILAGIENVNVLAGTNYRPTIGVLNAADFGVPQIRERVFIIGARDGRAFRFPDATHTDPGLDIISAQEPYRTAWDALGDLPAQPNDPGLEMTGKWAGLLPSIPEGQNYLWHTSRGGGLPLFGWRTRYWNFLLKLAKDRPSWTIQAQPGSATGPFHWKNRRLSGHELCRLQTFPENIQFSCGRGEVQRMLGNAVPSLLAEVLAWEIRRQLFGSKAKSTEYKLMPPRRMLSPPEIATSVPREYRHLIGSHAAHPGEGLGNRARLRNAAA